MGDALIDIGDVARRSGLAPSALRFYERKGLIAAVARNGLRRAYQPDVLDRLALIAAARASGFSLAEISDLLAAGPLDGRLHARLAAKADELDDRIDRLTAMRNGLRHAAACEHDLVTECPQFRAFVRAAVTSHGRSAIG